MKKIITVLLAFALLVSNPVLCKILFSEVSAEGTSLEFFYSKLDDFKKNKYGNNSKYVDDPVNTGGYTCFGFANEIAKHIFGSYPVTGTGGGNPNKNWIVTYDGVAIDSLCIGDIVRYDFHSIFITGIDGENVTFADANSDGRSTVQYDKNTTKAELRKAVSRYLTAPKTKKGWVAHYIYGVESGGSAQNSYVDVTENTYSVRTACNTEKALDVFVQSLDDKANVHLWDVGSQNSQKWNIVKNGSYYTIINVNSGKALDVENGDTASGTNVWQYKPNSTNAQRWRFEDAGNGYYYIRSACGLYLDLYGANTENGTNIAVYSNNGGSDNQKWKLVSCSPESQENGSNDGDDWGEWSAWTTTPVSATDNRQVDVGTAYVYYHYVLTDSDGSGAYPINRATMKANGFTYDSEEYHEYISMTELTRDTTGRLVYMVNGSRQVYDRFRNEHCTSEHKFIYSNYLYYKGTTTKYRYRDKNNTEHIHTYSEVKYEAEHPHNAYKICTSCGEKIYVPGGVCSTDCEECNPTVYYALYYDANGGIEPPSPQTAENGETVRISNGEPGKNGYTFIGWSYDRGSDRADLYGGDRITLTSDRTLYAVWEKKTDDSMILTIGSTSASVFGKTMYNDVAPLLTNGRTMLPARFVAENLGAEVSWNPENQCVTIRKGTRTIELYIGSDTAKVDGQTVSLDSTAFVKNSRTYCPIRFIAEALGANVEWNEAEQKVIITK